MSSTLQRMPRSQAILIAQAWMEQIRPISTRAEIAGSLRREKTDVGDIELVAVRNPAAIWQWQALLSREYTRYLAPVEREAYRTRSKQHDEWVKPTALAVAARENLPMVIKGGFTGKAIPRYTQVALPEGICLDLFTPEPDCWALTFFIRTGSADFSAAMAARSKSLGYIWHEARVYERWTGDRPIGNPFPLAEERDVFDFFKVRWVEPRDRVDAETLRQQKAT